MVCPHLLGQRIYEITPQNQATTLPNLHLQSEALSEIASGLNAGKHVIAHTDPISVPGWTGEGYIIYDPVDGTGAYKITGGSNGAWFFLGAISGILFGLLLLMTPGVGILMFAALSVGIHAFIALLVDLIQNDVPFDGGCFFVGILVGITLLAGTAFVGSFFVAGTATAAFLNAAGIAGILGFISGFLPGIPNPAQCLEI